MLYIIVLRK